MGVRGIFDKITVEIEEHRYKQLIQAELKAEQYKKELARLGEYDYLINIIEATDVAEEREEN